MSHAVYAAQTSATDLGEFGAWPGIGGLRPLLVPAMVRNLVVHMDLAGAVPAHRRDEPSMRHVAEMLARLRELGDAVLTAPRPAGRKLIGHCRTSSVLAAAFYRHLGVAARPRCGFAAYYAGGRDFYGDHWIVEVWDQAAAAWRLVDTELDAQALVTHGISFDPADVPREEFILAGQAWLDCRAGSAQARTFGPYPDRTGWRQLADQLARDAGCLCGHEAGPFDSWLPEPVTPGQERILDALAAATVRPDVTAADLDDLRTHHYWLLPPPATPPAARA